MSALASRKALQSAAKTKGIAKVSKTPQKSISAVEHISSIGADKQNAGSMPSIDQEIEYLDDIADVQESARIESDSQYVCLRL